MRTPLLLTSFALLLMAGPAIGDESIGILDTSFKSFTESLSSPLRKALSLLGTPYRFGGQNTDKGVDCSGFVRQVYKDSVDLDLPRTAREMSRTGEQVDKKHLQPGDLVFFRTIRKSISHVGIYAGNGEFVHASSRKAKEVTVSKLDDAYWAKHYGGARRVLDDVPADTR